MSEDDGCMFGASWLVCFAAFFGWLIGGCMAEKACQEDAVAHKAAYYDAKTDEFRWNDEPTTQTPEQEPVK